MIPAIDRMREILRTETCVGSSMQMMAMLCSKMPLKNLLQRQNLDRAEVQQKTSRQQDLGVQSTHTRPRTKGGTGNQVSSPGQDSPGSQRHRLWLADLSLRSSERTHYPSVDAIVKPMKKSVKCQRTAGGKPHCPTKNVVPNARVSFCRS